MLMHMEYRVTLPDHDWVVAPFHKLILFVYAGIVIEKDGLGNSNAVAYSGPKYVAIHSAKHSSSTAYSHARDISTVLKCSDFEDLTTVNISGDMRSVKPIGIFTVDGGPDESPRYAKVISSAIQYFATYDLDALYIGYNAPGRSSYDSIERRMAPLSKELVGVILLHDHYGTHLVNQGRTINVDEEKENFTHAGESLAEIWSNLVAKFIKPEESEIEELAITKKSME